MSKSQSRVSARQKTSTRTQNRAAASSARTPASRGSRKPSSKSAPSKQSLQQLIPEDIDIIKMNTNNSDIVVELSPIDIINMTNDNNMLLIKGDEEHCIQLNNAKEISGDSKKKAPYRAFSMGIAQVFVEQSIDVITH